MYVLDEIKIGIWNYRDYFARYIQNAGEVIIKRCAIVESTTSYIKLVINSNSHIHERLTPT